MYGSTANCHNHLPPTNRSIFEKLWVFQLEKNPYKHLISLFARGLIIRSTTYCLVFIQHNSSNPRTPIVYSIVGRDSVVGIMNLYGLVGQGIACRWGQGFPHPSRGFGSNSASNAMVTGSFHWVKQLERGVYHSPQCST